VANILYREVSDFNRLKAGASIGRKSFGVDPLTSAFHPLRTLPNPANIAAVGGPAMIFKRAVAKLRAQDWMAISIELVIVIVGVFIGIWAANWNQDRVKKQETREMLIQLKPELRGLQELSASIRNYYAVTGRYAETAFAGWEGNPRVSDEQFVIAAYQASQVTGLNNNGANWALVFGANELRNIDDLKVREPLTRLMTFEYSYLNYSAVFSRYRDEVREVIPDDIQQQIRAACGDKSSAERRRELTTPCELHLRPNEAASAAASLREHTELPRLLRLHRSTVAAYTGNLDLFDAQLNLLVERVSKL
jgi:hypothetical protein